MEEQNKYEVLERNDGLLGELYPMIVALDKDEIRNNLVGDINVLVSKVNFLSQEIQKTIKDGDARLILTNKEDKKFLYIIMKEWNSQFHNMILVV